MLKRAFTTDEWFAPRALDLRFLGDCAAVAKALKYMMRELVDVRKIVGYHARTRRLAIESYRATDPPAVTTVLEWQRALSAYAMETGGWNKKGRRAVDSAFGQLSDGLVNDTIQKLGAEREHRDDCLCKECVEWTHAVDFKATTPSVDAERRGAYRY